MKLNLKSVQNRKEWEAEGFKLPEFDIENVRRKTKEEPVWLHLGAGNLFRAFPAVVCQELLNKGITDKGIIVAEGYDTEIIDRVFTDYDKLSVCVTLNGDGSITKEVVASVTEALKLDFENEADTHRLKDIFASPTLEVVSFTITEKGYRIKNGDGDYLPDVQRDFKNSPLKAQSYIGKVAALCYHRYHTSRKPLTLLSMDNCSHNGSLLEAAVTAFADAWAENAVADAGFTRYVRDCIAYPWTMIDKITPRPSEYVKECLEKAGFEDAKTYITAKNTFVSAFVNAEAPQYLVIEDSFKNGRPPLDKGGIIFTDRETVDKVEQMKVCTCLNPLHTALAVFGCLLGYEKISDEMKDKSLVSLVRHIGYDEGLPVVTDPKIISPRAFIDEVIGERLPNPFLPDSPRRIACDTSQKVGIRFGRTIKAYDDKAGGLIYIPLAIAGWLRYLTGYDDNGRELELSPDPMLDELMPPMRSLVINPDNIKVDEERTHRLVPEILSRSDIFGVDLNTVGLGDKIEGYFLEMTGEKGSVRKTLDKYCKV
jgi:fructuronate reductase